MLTHECSWVRKYGQHGEVAVYERPWRRLFRKQFFIRCWGCDLRRPC